MLRQVLVTMRERRGRRAAEAAICALCRAEYHGRGAPGCPGACRVGSLASRL